MNDPNEGVVERDEAHCEPSKVCAQCGGRFRELSDGWCSPCLQIGRWSPEYRRAEYKFAIRVPGIARLCRCDGRLPHVHESVEPAIYKFVTKVGATEAARVYGELAKCRIEVEEL